MQIELELIDESSCPAVFRVAFFGATDRLLLQYPQTCELRFYNASGDIAAEWRTSVLISASLDDFVLAPNSRIAFDLRANINPESTTEGPWSILLPDGDYLVKYVYHVDRDTDWYDSLGKRSRLAGITPIWRGTQESNAVNITIANGRVDTAK